MINDYMKRARVRKNIHPTLVAFSMRKPVKLLLDWEEGKQAPDAADLFRWCRVLGEDYLRVAKEVAGEKQ